MAAGYYSAATFRILGTAATPQNLCTIENIDAAVLVKVRRVVVQLDATAVLTSVMPLVKCSRPTDPVPANGTVLSKAQFDTTAASSGNVIVRGGNASDGGVASAITATAGVVLWQQYCMRMHTVVGQVLALDNAMVPTLCETTPVILRQNEALLFQIVASAGGSNPNTNHWFVQICWEEA